MPYYSVRVTETVSHEFMVCAADRDAAENIVSVAVADLSCDPEKIIRVRTDSDSGFSLYDSNKAHWDEATQNKKEE